MWYLVYQKDACLFFPVDARSEKMKLPYCPREVPTGVHSSKRQKFRVGGYTENVLKWFNYPHARAHPDAKLAAMGPNRLASSVHLWFVKASPKRETAVSVDEKQSSDKCIYVPSDTIFQYWLQYSKTLPSTPQSIFITVAALSPDLGVWVNIDHSHRIDLDGEIRCFLLWCL